MSRILRPDRSTPYGVSTVCRHLGFPRSSYYEQTAAAEKIGPDPAPLKRGPKTPLDDDALLALIRADLAGSHFTGEGHRKVHARLRFVAGHKVGLPRILRIMRAHRLLSPHRAPRAADRKHDGRITTDAPGVRIATDGAQVTTRKDGLVWVFLAVDHYNSECLGAHVCKRGDRFAAYEPVAQAKAALAAAGLPTTAVMLRHDHGCQYMSEWFQSMARHNGFVPDYAFVGEPETNGVIERFNRTWKEQVAHGRVYDDIDALRTALLAFIGKYNAHWQLERHGYKSPVDARLAITFPQPVAEKAAA